MRRKIMLECQLGKNGHVCFVRFADVPSPSCSLHWQGCVPRPRHDLYQRRGCCCRLVNSERKGKGCSRRLGYLLLQALQYCRRCRRCDEYGLGNREKAVRENTPFMVGRWRARSGGKEKRGAVASWLPLLDTPALFCRMRGDIVQHLR